MSPRQTVRTGFSLLELLIVLLIMAVIAAMVWPAVERMHRRNQIQSSARQIRGELAEARTRAIESGIPYIFQFKPSTGEYRIGPRPQFNSDGSSLENMVAANDPARAQAPADAVTAAGPEMLTQPSEEVQTELAAQASSEPITVSVDASGTAHKLLPAGVTFWTNRISDQTRDQTTSADPNALPDLAVATPDMLLPGYRSPVGDNWSEAIVFYPNGRTSSATVTLFLEDENTSYSIDITLRGLTGASHIGTLTSLSPEQMQLAMQPQGTMP